MLTIGFEIQKTWPKLAWVAKISPDKETVIVFHGSMVEIGVDWAVEGVWAGTFGDFDFDKTDLFYGSGIRKRNNVLTFVSSASGVDRLWYVKYNEKYYVSNTLPGLLQKTGLNLLMDYKFYAKDLTSVQTLGLNRHVKIIKTNYAELHVVYFKNICWNSSGMMVVDKPDTTPELNTFEVYKQYMYDNAVKLGENARDAQRKFKIDLLVGLSSGYDSIATAIISKQSGCKKAASIVNPSSFWRGSDSGLHISKKLGLSCQILKHDKKKYRQELSVWASTGSDGGRNLTLFDYPKPLCLFFSGGYGDVVWDINHPLLSEPRGGVNEMLCEFRLIEGLFITVVPWWGIRKAQEIQKINQLKEMVPWSLGTDYDRPVARRIIEEAGISRGHFAIRKKNTASNNPYWWPSTKEAHDKFNQYLIEHGMKPSSRFKVKFLSIFYVFIKLINSNFLKFLSEEKKWRPWLKSQERHMFFVWANHTLRDEYYK